MWRSEVPSPTIPPALCVPAPARAALGLALALLALLAACVGFQAVWSWDIGFYLAMGHRIVAEGAIPSRDPLTFPLADRPLVDMYWLYEVAVWTLYRAGGTVALIAAHGTATLAALGLAFRQAVRKGRSGAWPALALLAFFILGNTWELRPHSVSWLLLAALVEVLDESRRKAHPWILGAVPAIMAVWANTHPLFALGLGVVGAHALAEVLRGRQADRRLLAAAVAGAAACLLTPYGLRGLTIPLEQLANLRGDSVFKAASGISEYRSPLEFGVYRMRGASFWYHSLPWMHAWLAAAILALPFAWRGAGWGERASVLAMLLAFTDARKNFGYFVVVGLPMVAQGLGGLTQVGLRRLPRRAAAGGARWIPWLAPVVAGLALAVVGTHVGNGFFDHGRRGADRSGTKFCAGALPVGAASFLHRADLPPLRLLNALHDGGYLSFATGRKTFIDGRLEVGGAAWFAEYVGTASPDGLKAALARYAIECVVVPYSDLPSWFVTLVALPDWRCVHLDGYAAVFLRSDVAPAIPALARGLARAPVATPEWLRLLRQAEQRREPGLVGSLRGPHYYPLTEIRLCRAFIELDMPASALAVGARGLRRATFPAPALLLNVANAFSALGHHELAATARTAAQRSAVAKD